MAIEITKAAWMGWIEIGVDGNCGRAVATTPTTTPITQLLPPPPPTTTTREDRLSQRFNLAQPTTTIYTV